jgi:hypothetical protein
MTPVADVVQLGDLHPQLVCEALPDTTTVGDGILVLGEVSIQIPPLEAVPTLELRQLIWELQVRTGWSARALAEVLRTTHTTINRVVAGGRLQRGRSGDLRRRLGEAHEVVARVYVLAGSNADATAHVLQSVAPSGQSPVALLRDDEPARAYLAALDTLNARREGLLVGSHPRGGDATAPLHD